jgi:hypothetical protein
MEKKIMLIRHAEKPPDDNSAEGVSQAGKTDPEELIVRGWQRAGALVRFFVPLRGFAHPALATPDVIFASAVAKHSSSLRPQHTVVPLSGFLGKRLNLNHAKGDEAQLVKDVLGTAGTILISWEHKAIPDVAGLICNNTVPYPKTWPDDRFDLVWVFDRGADTQPWVFTQVPQLLLAGDSSAVLPLA